jgi:formylglycine-generating enzyme required for sulfatase activity
LGERPKWTALAYLSPDAQEAINAIKQELQRLTSSADGKERIKWAALVESYADLLSEKGFQPLLLEWAQQTLDNQPIQDEATKIAAQMGITLQSVKFQVAIITQEDEPTEELQPFDFLTVTVDARGKVVNREKQRGFYFVELLSDDNQVDFEESEKLKEKLILLEEKDRLIKLTQELSQNLTYQQTTIDEKKTYFNLIKINERISEIDETLKRLSPQQTQQQQTAKLQQQLFYLSQEKNNLLEDKKSLENNLIYVNSPAEQTKLQQDLLRVDKEISQIEKALEELPLPLTLPVPLQQAQLKSIGLEMVAIPGGEFVMGSPPKELERRNSESPQHTVTVQPFFMGRYQVTQAQWQFVAQLPQVNRKLDPDPSSFKGAKRPVERVSWYDAVEFCSRLSQHTGRNYRLPSEAEWEYACRAGTTTPFHFGKTITTDLANYDGNSTYGDGVKGVYREETTDVGNFGVANNFGLYDMHGNVREWCLDDWHDNYEGAPTDGSAWFNSNEKLLDKTVRAVLRGGSWFDDPDLCRSAYRLSGYRDNHFNFIGFRVVCAVGRILQ